MLRARHSVRVRPSVPLDAFTRPPADPPLFPLDRAPVVLPSLGAALAAAARRLGVAPGAAVHAPADRAPVVRAAGLTPAAPADDAALVLLVHRLGLPADGAAERARCDERGVPLVEDVSEALLAWTPDGPAGTHGHAAIAALGPVLGLAGALLAVPGDEEADPPAPEGARLRRAAGLLPRLAHAGVQGRRRGHHAYLAAALGLEADLPEGASPLVLAFPAADVAGVRDRCERAGIETLALGDAVGLPVHQELTPADLDRIAAAAAGPARPARPAPEVVALEGLEAAEPVWRRLAEQGGNLFGTYEWAAAWTAHLGEGDLALRLVREGGRDAALLPLIVQRKGPLTLARLVGHGPGDRLGPIAHPRDLPLAARGLRRALDELGVDVLVGETLPREDGWGGMVGATTLTRQASPVLHIGGRTWDEFLAARSRNFREQARRRERALRKAHEVEFRLSDPERLDADLDTLFALHDARWEGTTETFAGATGDFHRDFARRALEAGWLRLILLEVDGQAVAAWEGFRYAGVEWYYQSGRDPEWERRSVGFVLLAHTVREAFDAGMREYRLLRGGEEYKSRFSTHDPGLETAALGRTVAGRAAVVAGAGALRMPAEPRRRIRQLLR